MGNRPPKQEAPLALALLIIILLSFVLIGVAFVVINHFTVDKVGEAATMLLAMFPPQLWMG